MSNAVPSSVETSSSLPKPADSIWGADCKRDNISAVLPLAPMQEGILLQHVLSPDGGLYIKSILLTLPSRKHLDLLIASLQLEIDTNSAWRIGILWEHLPDAVQVVYRRAPIPVEEISTRNALHGIQLVNCLKHAGRQRFDLHKAPLVRVYVATDNIFPELYVLLQLHHACFDYQSLWNIVASLATQLGAPKFTHTESEKQRQPSPGRLRPNRGDAETFFFRRLCTIEKPTAPFGVLDSIRDASLVGECRREVAPSLCQRLRAEATRLDVRPAVFFHAAWAIVLAHTSGQDEVVFGTVLSTRERTGRQTDCGILINTLPLRLNLEELTVRRLLEEAQRELDTLRSYRDFPPSLTQCRNRLPDGAPLFTALLNYRRSAYSLTSLLERADGCHVLADEEVKTHYPVACTVDDFGEQFVLTVQTDNRLDPALVAACFQVALESIADAVRRSPELPALAVSALPDSERRKLIETFNETATPCPRDRLIHELVEEQCASRPQAVAALCGGDQLSYGELNRRANQVAHYLRSQGVVRGQRVAILLERGFELIVALLGVLKSGGTYVPLDPRYPSSRIAHMLHDSAARTLLTQEALLDANPDLVRMSSELNVTALDGDVERARIIDQFEGNPNPAELGVTPRDLAYIIYTSGSTGAPKGIKVPHASVVNLIDWVNRTFRVNTHDTLLFVTSICFDLSVYDIFGVLSSGGKIWVAKEDTVSDPQRQAEIICREGITFWDSAPAALQLLLPYLKRHEARQAPLRLVFSSGDWIPLSLPTEIALYFPHARFISLGGATEATVWSNWYEVQEGDPKWKSIPYGKPIQNARYYVLNSALEPRPIGVAGDLYIGGDCLAEGYTDDDLTREQFIASPFVAGDRLFRTGDLARYGPDGNIEFLGRNDFQIKIRGFRVEPGEIEATLLMYSGIREAVVVAREDSPDDKRLVAYYTTTDDTSIYVDALREQLARRLPSYMVPAAYVQLASLPLNANGKLDRKSLPAPNNNSYPTQEYQAPIGPVEIGLAQIWSEVLQVKRIGRNDNFFALGGHSLLVMRLLERMRRDGFEVDARTLFAQPTVCRLAEEIGVRSAPLEVPQNLIRREFARITPDLLPLIRLSQQEIDRIVASVPGGVSNVQDIYGLIPLQEGILFHHRIASNGDPYVLRTLLTFVCKEGLDAYVAALNAVIVRHDILRTAVMWEGLSRAVQVVWRYAPLQAEELAIDPAGGDAILQLRERLQTRHDTLDVRRAPMIRLFVARDPTQQRWIGIQLHHHLVQDAVTIEMMQAEMQAHLYQQAALLPTPIPFRQFVALTLRPEGDDREEQFFRSMLKTVEEPTAPFGLLEVHGDGAQIEERHQQLPPSLSEGLRHSSRKLGVSAASLFHVAWALVLARTSGQRAPVFGSVVFGRMQGNLDVTRIMGPLLNTLPFRVQLEGVEIGECVRKTHDLLMQLLMHSSASLADVQRYSLVPAGTPLFTTLFNYRHGARRAHRASDSMFPASSGTECSPIAERSNYPFTVSVDDWGTDFELSVQVDRAVGAERVFTMMVTSLERVVAALTTSTEQAVSDLDVLPAIEREQLLMKWNATAAPYPKDRCLHDLFADHAAQTPDAIAVLQGETALSYKELNDRANQLALRLRALGVGPDQRVVVFMNRSVGLVVELLGVLKASGAYVPVDPGCPSARLAYVLRDSCAAAILSDQTLVGRVSEPPIADLQIPRLLLDRKGFAAEPGGASEMRDGIARSDITSRNLAYVTYTSGSTGEPKGVMVEHASVVNLLTSIRKRIGFTPSDCILAVTTISFDIAALEILLPLLTGARVVLADRDIALDAGRLAAMLDRFDITALQATPATWQALVSAGWTGRRSLKALCGGEAMPVELARQLLPRVESLWNLYGPTETTIWSCARQIARVDEHTALEPIGGPIANTRIYLLDTHERPVPIGVTGEIHIGGTGVSRGYLNRDALTADRFIDSPFVDGDRLYRTGDLGRYRPDGTIEFLGRSDFQIKVRGFRIEPGEIESQLLALTGIREALVVALEEEPGDTRLVAYYTVHDGAIVRREDFKEQLSRALPNYMVPAAYVPLASMPLTANGKVDRKRLPAPNGGAYITREYETPMGPTETTLAQIWRNVLRIEQVGRHSNFFELGGHSLLGLKVIAQVAQSLKVELPVETLFVAPDLLRMAQVIDALMNGKPLPFVSLSQPKPTKRPIRTANSTAGPNKREIAYYLVKQVFVCFFDEHVVFLDIKRDQYGAIGRREAESLAGLVAGWPDCASDGASISLESDGTAQLVDDLVAQGILTKSSEVGKSASPISLETSETVCTASADGTLPVAVALKFVAAFIAGSCAFAFLSLERNMNRIRSRRTRSFPTSGPTHAELQRALATYERCARLVGRLLRNHVHSRIVQIEYLAGLRIYPNWVFGVHVPPFSAYSWLQQSAMPLGEDLKVLRQYRPIFYC